MCDVQEDESVKRASGVASTSAREAVGLDACLQVSMPSLQGLTPHTFSSTSACVLQTACDLVSGFCLMCVLCCTTRACLMLDHHRRGSRHS